MRPSPLPNRIDPLGAERAVAARGAWTGNRGVIHRGHEIVKRAATDGWVTCLLDFQGRRRPLMTPGRWTELFFLDEATAFAAGHRPCFYCRRDDAKRFAAAWGAGAGLGRAASAKEMDARMKTERRHAGRRNAAQARRLIGELPRVEAADLAPGAMALCQGAPYLWTAGGFMRWTFEGYAPERPDGPMTLLTPVSVLAAFRAGYAPQIDPSAQA